ncbi:uncharacterized protein LOC111873839 isoform X2 [Cryptotermes secundus]|uniref:uncharacterized protein LOC111873839 isoform X2 n=1 Tax=Cryptotermes secundus TaxID=105785 RepID=UPI000CD7CBEB|nr:uncharacterized protein LOC111873839 isoform X2 [Cryptotermes secundus]
MKTLAALVFVLAAATWATCLADGVEEPDCDHIGYSPHTIRKEICGSDGQTYSNEKHLEFENCLYKRVITKVKDGWCKEEDQKRADERRNHLAEEEAKRIQEVLEHPKPST